MPGVKAGAAQHSQATSSHAKKWLGSSFHPLLLLLLLCGSKPQTPRPPPSPVLGLASGSRTVTRDSGTEANGTAKDPVCRAWRRGPSPSHFD